jgi:HK97 family phage major capsid protein
MSKPKGRPGTALGALYHDDAPGAALNGEVAGWGELAQAARADFAGESTAAGRRLRKVQATAMGERTPSGGGFLVPEDMRSDMILASLEAAVIRPRATVIPASTLRLGIPTVDDTTHASNSLFGGLTWNWTEENTAVTTTSPAYARIVYEAKKLAAYLGAVPDELVADAGAFAAFASTAVPMGLAWSEDQAFMAGTGAGQPQGILNAPCAISVTRSTASKVLQIDIVNMVTRMLPQSLNECIWLCSPDVIGQLLQLYLLIGTIPVSSATAPSAWLTGTPGDGWSLLGRPVFVTEHVPKLGTTGDLILVDPKFYVIVDRMRMELATSALGTGFSKDETEFRVISRLDGRIWLQSPVTPQNASATVSPVVILN